MNDGLENFAGKLTGRNKNREEISKEQFGHLISLRQLNELVMQVKPRQQYYMIA